MNTDAVMCMALTRQRASWTRLFSTSCSTVGVMFTKPRRFGTSNHKCSVSDFMAFVYSKVVFLCERGVAHLKLEQIRFVLKPDTRNQPKPGRVRLTVLACFVLVGIFRFVGSQLLALPMFW